MSVYVIAKDGRSLMPCSEAKAKHLLDKGIAKVKHRTPFTIQMLVVTNKLFNCMKGEKLLPPHA